MTLEYYVEWRDGEYVATCLTVPDVSGHSKLAVYALASLQWKLKALGHDVGPVNMKDWFKAQSGPPDLVQK